MQPNPSASQGGGPPLELDDAMRHPNLPLWTAMIRQIQRPATGREQVLDYGCGEGQFLRVLNRLRPFGKGIGVDVDTAALERGRRSLRDGEPIEFGAPDRLKESNWVFDQIYIQEVFWMIEDVATLATQLHGLLRDGGECYATMGCHTDNPLWEHRKAWLEKQEFTAFDYSVDEIAKYFYEAGFEVGVKRLPVDEFTVYHPRHTPTMTRSLAEQVKATAEHKMLFHFRRDDAWRAGEAERDVTSIN